MVRFRKIEREHIIVRRAEADACLHYLLHHSATLTACSAVELLLEYLVANLYEKLSHSGKRQAKSLVDDVGVEERRTGSRIQYWGLNSWVGLYSKRGIIDKLQDHLDLRFETLNVASLRVVNDVWNISKHDPYLATHDTALKTVGLLHGYLDEAQIKPGNHSDRPYFVRRMSAQWLGKWEEPLLHWVAANQNMPHTEILFYLAPLLDLFVRLIDDERVKYKHKSALLVAANYVFSSLDLIPEDSASGEVYALVDDGAVLALSLVWLLQQDDFDPAILNHHWPNGASIRDEASKLNQHLLQNHEILFPDSRGQIGSRLVWGVIERIAEFGPEALWQNYWKEQSTIEAERPRL
ncbi:MAG: hypothetical protein OXG49_11940 [Chloroflexi bacterium]|nr:hypothetical protein [Chloroflexota bacterium]